MLVHPQFDEVAFGLGPLKVRWYGLSYLAGFAIAWALANYRAKKNDWPWNTDEVADLLFYVVVGVIVGGRLGSVFIYNFDQFLADPSMVYKVWEGGMSFHGGLIGVLISMGVFAKVKRKAYFQVTDFIAVVVPVGLLTGRIGNFINAELWGRPTDVPWGMVFPNVDQLPRHPSQLYEAGLEGLTMFLILWFFTVKARPRMVASGLFLILYGSFRSFVELFREPDRNPDGTLLHAVGDWLTYGQLLSLPMIAAGIVIVAIGYKRQIYDRVAAP